MADTRVANAEMIEYFTEVEGPHYVAEADRYDDMLAGFDQALLDAAALRPGERVLDVGCGTGGTTLAAARRVAPGGSVVGVDVSGPMLALALERARAAGLDAASFLEADAQVHSFAEAEIDAVISRFGLMFFADPDAAFANLARALRRGGRIAFVAWQGLAKSEWIMTAGAAAAPHIGIPAGLGPDQPGPYGLADPDRVRHILDRAGYSEITVDSVTRPMRVGKDVEDALAFIRSMPRVAALFAAATPAKAEAAIEAAHRAMEPYAGPEGVVMNENGAWLVTARR